jgi:hypothetical protein
MRVTGVYDDEFEDLTLERLFLPVTSLWQALGAIGRSARGRLRVWPPLAEAAG